MNVYTLNIVLHPTPLGMSQEGQSYQQKHGARDRWNVRVPWARNGGGGEKDEGIQKTSQTET